MEKIYGVAEVLEEWLPSSNDEGLSDEVSENNEMEGMTAASATPAKPTTTANGEVEKYDVHGEAGGAGEAAFAEGAAIAEEERSGGAEAPPDYETLMPRLEEEGVGAGAGGKEEKDDGLAAAPSDGSGVGLEEARMAVPA